MSNQDKIEQAQEEIESHVSDMERIEKHISACVPGIEMKLALHLIANKLDELAQRIVELEHEKKSSQ